MMARLAALFATTCLFTGCTNLTVEQERLIADAHSIQGSPIERSVLLKTLGLNGVPSQRVDGSVQSRIMSYAEAWQHESGLTIYAYDSEYVGELAVVPGSGNERFSSDAANRKASDYIGKPVGPPRQSFESFIVTRNDKVLFTSVQKEKGEWGRRE